MNGTTIVARDTNVPSCFGTKEYDPNEPECAGGADANYTNPRTGSHVREQCQVFHACGAKGAALQNATRVIPPEMLVRPPVVTPPPQQAPAHDSTFAGYLARQQAVYQANLHQQAIETERQRLAGLQGRPATAAAPMPPGIYHPAGTYQLNYQMPQYLTQPEQRMPGETIWAVLLRETIRSMFKALGHAVAHFFDARSLKEPERKQ